MVKTRPRPLWHLVLTAVLVLGAISVVLLRQWQERPAEPDPPVLYGPAPEPANSAQALGDSLLSRVVPSLAEVGIWPDLVTCKQIAGGPDRVSVRVPRDLPLAVVNQGLTELALACGGRVIRAEETAPARQVEIRVGFDTVATTVFVLQRAARVRRRTGRIALIIDDFGYDNTSGRRARAFCDLPPQLSFAVLPNAHSIEAFLQAAEATGHPVLLHLPMEPEDPRADPGPGAITVEQDARVIRARVLAALERVPGAVGVNNHMGSRATADSRVMEVVLETLRERQLFFLDSRTTPETVGYALARGMGVPTARRDLFIDPVDDRSAVEARLWELADKAGRMGEAIGIGHDRSNTLLALQAVLPRLRTRGFHLVPVSQLVR